MLFPTYQFLLFFSGIFALAIFLKHRVFPYKFFLLAASLAFYSFWSTKFLNLLLADIVINYCFLRCLSLPVFAKNEKSKKLFLFLGIAFNLCFLGFFKYYNFFVDSLFSVLNSLNLQASFQVLQIIAPVGISFYTFRIISNLVDCYQKKLSCPSFLDYAVYVTFFPQIASGPIARAKDFYIQLNSPRKYDYKIEQVVVLILSGLFKKYTLSSFLFEFTQLPFKVPQQYSSIDLILAALAYSCLIYVDFSGYSDLANAISSLLGFQPILNFNMPYRSLSVQEFWHRWHISLSEWLKDYLYIPLGGNRHGKTRKYLNLLLTMLIGGFWHGAGVNFIIWGGIHGGGLIANHWWKELTQKTSIKLNRLFQGIWKILCWGLTFSFITLTWIFFNTQTWEASSQYIQGIFHSDVKTFLFNFWQLYAVFAIVLLMNFYGQLINNWLVRNLHRMTLLIQVVFVSLLAYIIFMLGPSTVAPFIYFSF
jgi:alginate O-acetyltransferase complex protein AlgI